MPEEETSENSVVPSGDIDLLEEYESKVKEVEDSFIKLAPDFLSLDKQQQSKIENQKRFLHNLILFHGNVGRAARATGMSRRYVSKWKEDPVYKLIYDSIEEDLLDVAEEQLQRHISMGSLPAVTFYLKTKGKERGYGDKLDINHNIDDFDQRLIAGRNRGGMPLKPVDAIAELEADYGVD